MRLALLVATLATILPQSVPPSTVPAQASTLTVRVFVHKVDTNDGIPNATVVASPNSPPPRPGATPAPPQRFTAVTDASGIALFPDLPGDFTSAYINVQCDGYFGASRGPIGAQFPTTAGLTLAVDNSKKEQSVDIPMVAGATISGRIEDEQGQPITGAQLRVYTKGWVDGRPGWQSASLQGVPGRNMNTTDDRGEYRLFWFPPGDYYVRAEAPRSFTFPRLDNRLPLPAPVTYFPGTMDETKALPVTVKSGEDRVATDFAIPSISGVTISGAVFNPLPGGRPMGNGQVFRGVGGLFLIRKGSQMADVPSLANTARGANSDPSKAAFELRNIQPGSYDLYTQFTTSTDPRDPPAIAHTEIDVSDKDISGIQMTFRPNTELTGRLIFDGETPPAGFGSIRLDLMARNQSPVNRGRRNATMTTGTDPDVRQFTVSGLSEEAFAVVVSNVPRDSYVADIRLGSTSVYDSATIQVSNALTDPLDIIIRSPGGRISGTVQKEALQAASRVVVLLIPSESRRGNQPLYKTTTTDNSGAFEMDGIAPGEYELITLPSIPSGNPQQDPDFIARYESYASTITVKAGQTMGVQLTLPKP